MRDLKNELRVSQQERTTERTQQAKRVRSDALHLCADCGKEFAAVAEAEVPLGCCDACHALRLQLVDRRTRKAKFREIEWGPLEKRQWLRSPALWVVAVVAVTIAGAGLFLVPRVKRSYHRWTERRSVERARESYAKGDFKHALLDARNAVTSNPQNIEATRVIAKSLEAAGSPQALQWRGRLASISPGDAENAVAWAADALKAGDATTAEHALAGMKTDDRHSARYHDIAASLALSKRDTEAAESHWAEAAKLDPEEDRHRLNLASVRMKSSTPGARAGAIEILKELSGKPGTRLVSLRLMLGDALGRDGRHLCRQAAPTLRAACGERSGGDFVVGSTQGGGAIATRRPLRTPDVDEPPGSRVAGAGKAP